MSLQHKTCDDSSVKICSIGRKAQIIILECCSVREAVCPRLVSSCSADLDFFGLFG